jgi:subtilisin family serine protease
VDAVTYTAGIMSQGSASGALVSGGLCDIVPADGSWSGKVVICKRGSIFFSTKVINVGQSGGVAAVIYNNVPGSFVSIIKEQNITIPAVSLSMEDGEYVVTNNLDLNGNVVSNVIKNASGYDLKDGTSMAAPHVSAVAALVWSVMPNATNTEVRAALIATAEDLGEYVGLLPTLIQYCRQC